MRRDPSVHIRLSDLKKELKELGVEKPHKTAELLARRAVRKAPVHRVRVSGVHKKRKQQLDRILGSEEQDAELLNQVLLQKRGKEAGIDRMHIPRKGSKDWKMLRNVAQVANDFVKEIGFDEKRPGYEAFISKGLEFMKSKFSLNRFVSLRGKIIDRYRAELRFQQESRKMDKLLAKHYYQRIEESTGAEMRGDIEPEKYEHFIDAAGEAEGMKATPEDWIEAQFYGLEFVEALPEVYQLHGENARDRYLKYMYEEKNMGNRKEVPGHDPEEKGYLQRVQNKKKR